MDPIEAARETLDAMLGYLGFAATVTADASTLTLHVASHDGRLLIGPRGERLEEMTHLVNRLLLDRIPEAPRIHVDVENFLASRDFRMIEEAEEAAARVIATGRSVKLEPMNSYQRRLIHHHFKDHPSVRTWSPEDNARLKRISISPRSGSGRRP
jgi:spoIIIJ-associated protein